MLEDTADFPTKRFVSGVFSLYASPDTVFMNYNDAALPDTLPANNSNFDILFECRGDKNTDFFLQSPNLIENSLVRLFKYIHNAKLKEKRAIKGVNFYFPDYSFKEKRAMAQFARAVSVVTDSCRLETIRSLSVYFSFNQQGEGHKKYLACLAEMADSVFILNNTFNDTVFTPVTTVTYKDAKNYFLLSKIMDQFYFAHNDQQPFPYTSDYMFIDTDIVRLIRSDYPGNNSEVFNFSRENQYLLLFVPVSFVFIVPIVKVIKSKNELP
jgi:hypothetical protein